MPTTTEIKYWDKIASQTTIDPQFKSTCLGCKFLIREEKPECFLHYLVRIDKEGNPWPIEKCSRREELFEAKIRKKHKPYNEYPLRLCYSMHDCEICKKTILCGEYYYDGGLGRRVHQDCVDEPKVDNGTS